MRRTPLLTKTMHFLRCFAECARAIPIMGGHPHPVHQCSVAPIHYNAVRRQNTGDRLRRSFGGQHFQLARAVSRDLGRAESGLHTCASSCSFGSSTSSCLLLLLPPRHACPPNLCRRSARTSGGLGSRRSRTTWFRRPWPAPDGCTLSAGGGSEPGYTPQGQLRRVEQGPWLALGLM